MTRAVESAPARTSVNLGSVERIPLGEGRQFQAHGMTIAIFRSRDGSLAATQADCPHKGGPLADGILGQRTLICPLHAYGFDLISGRPAGHTCGALRTYPVSLNLKEQIIVVIDETGS